MRIRLARDLEGRISMSDLVARGAGVSILSLGISLIRPYKIIINNNRCPYVNIMKNKQAQYTSQNKIKLYISIEFLRLDIWIQ